MLRNYYINKEWILSDTARLIYRVAASLSLVLFVLFIVVGFTGGVPESLVPTVKLLLLAGILGAAITMVAMEYFLFGFDNSSELKKVFWFCVLLFPPLGPPLYCFIVYSRSDAFNKKSAKERVTGL
jgi:hypothetical protein